LNHYISSNQNTAYSLPQSFLHCSNEQPTITYLLLSHPELDVMIRDKNGWTPFATAMTHKDNKAAQAILNRAPTAADQVTSERAPRTGLQRQSDCFSTRVILSNGPPKPKWELGIMGGAHSHSGCSVGAGNYGRSSFSQWVFSRSWELWEELILSVSTQHT